MNVYGVSCPMLKAAISLLLGMLYGWPNQPHFDGLC